jgi:hypothetical protein
LVFELVQLHGGTVNLTSQLGHGTFCCKRLLLLLLTQHCTTGTTCRVRIPFGMSHLPSEHIFHGGLYPRFQQPPQESPYGGSTGPAAGGEPVTDAALEAPAVRSTDNTQPEPSSSPPSPEALSSSPESCMAIEFPATHKPRKRHTEVRLASTPPPPSSYDRAYLFTGRLFSNRGTGRRYC